MESVADFYKKPRRVVFTYEGDAMVPSGTGGTTKGFPLEIDDGAEYIPGIVVVFDNGVKFQTAFTDLEFEA